MKNSALKFNKIIVCAGLVLLMALALCFAAPQAWALEHDASHTGMNYTPNGDGTHTVTCATAECEYSSTEDCRNYASIPAATCETAMVCSKCNAVLEPALTHDWKHDEGGTTHTCQREGCGISEGCSYAPSATCLAASECSVCKHVYQEQLSHVYTYSADSQGIYYKCESGCGRSGQASIVLSGTSFSYSSAAIEPASISYTNGWPEGNEPSLSYSDNVNAGTATVTMTLGELSHTKTFTITPVNIAFLIDHKEVTYGDELPTLSYTIQNLMPNDTEQEVFTSVPILSCPDYAPGKAVSSPTCHIEIDLSAVEVKTENNNYILQKTVTVPGVLTIKPRTLSISLSSTEWTYDGTALDEHFKAIAGNVFSTDDVQLSYSISGPLSDGKVVDAGDYTLTVTGITGAAADNYALPENRSLSFKVLPKAQDAPPIGRFATSKESIKGIKDGSISGLLETMEYKPEGGADYTAVPAGVSKIENLASGTYLIRYAATQNYLASEPVSITVGYEKVLTVTYPSAPKGVTVSGPTEFDYGADVTVSLALADGYELSTDFALMQAETKLLSAAGSKTISGATADIVLSLSGSTLDTQAPVCAVSVSGVKLTGHSKAPVFTVTVEDNDAVKSIEYLKSATQLDEAALKSAGGWKSYNGSVAISGKDRTLYFYAKATDESGNVSFAESGPVVYDTTAPVISGISNGATYYTSQKFSFADANLDTATVNGASVSSGSVIAGDVSATYTLIVTDKAGNSSTVSVTMKPLSELETALSGINTKRPTASDLALIKKVQNILGNECANASSGEIAKLNAMLDSVSSAADVAGSVELLTKLVNSLPNIHKIGPENDAIVRKVDNAMRYWNSMSKLEQSFVSEEIRLKLGIAYDYIREYRIVEGGNGVYVLKSNKALNFTANGVYRKFTWLEIDGEYVEPGVGKYISDSGSTIISLQPVFLETLSEGRHNIVVHYTDGQTYLASFTVASRYSPRTGDTANLPLWGSLMALCLVGTAGAVIYLKKKEN